jgi:diguanylate cyclase (GGDEF)-like protein
MPKKALTALVVFGILILPAVALSLWAYTVFHQIILLVTAVVVGWVSYYLSDVIVDRDRLSREVFMQAYELKQAKEALGSCLATDSKTQFYNQKLLESRMDEECTRSRRYSRPLSFLLFEVDQFNEFEQANGIGTGAVIVQELGEFLREGTRSVDIIVRRGEKGFIAILPETAHEASRIVAERMRYSIEKNTFLLEGKPVKITVSGSFIGFDPATHRTKEDVIEMLERAMQHARKAGPNHIGTLVVEKA